MPSRRAAQALSSAVIMVAAMLKVLIISGIGLAHDTTTRVSVDSSGIEGNGNSEFRSSQSLSKDGRYVVFASYAKNLVPGDTNNRPDIFVCDRLDRSTKRVNVSSSGQQANDFSGRPCICANGRFVAFNSRATTLVPGDTNDADDVFVHDVLTGETTLVSVDSAGTQGNSVSGMPSLSADGRWVAFASLATNLVPSDTNGVMDVFVHDRFTHETTRVSVDSTGSEGNGASADDEPSISADGRYVVFESYATNLVPGDTNHDYDVFVHDRLLGQTERVSLTAEGTEPHGSSWSPSVSADGRLVAFMSNARDMVPFSRRWSYQNEIFVRDRVAGETTRVSIDSAGVPAEGYSWYPAISADGRYVAFGSEAKNLVKGDINNAQDVFVHDRTTSVTRRVSVSVADVQANIYTETPSISNDGRFVAFEGGAWNLVLVDTNLASDIFVRGPELTLDASSGEVTVGQLLTLTQYFSTTGNPASLWTVAVNGLLLFQPVAIGAFNDGGTFVVSGAVPPELVGNSIVFRGYGFGASGTVDLTNDLEITCR